MSMEKAWKASAKRHRDAEKTWQKNAAHLMDTARREYVKRLSAEAMIEELSRLLSRSGTNDG
jgi:hypothetical protein